MELSQINAQVEKKWTLAYATHLAMLVITVLALYVGQIREFPLLEEEQELCLFASQTYIMMLDSATLAAPPPTGKEKVQYAGRDVVDSTGTTVVELHAHLAKMIATCTARTLL